MTAAVELQSVSVVVDGAPILDAVTTTIPAGACTVVVGPSGAGKSTLLRLCNRLAVPSSGRVLIDGRDVADLDPLALRRRMGMVFQRPVAFAGSVRDNLLVADPVAGEPALLEALDRAGLPPTFLDRVADSLSGGEAQRMCLARTLLTGPEALLMDEPTSALDGAAARALEDHVRTLVDGGVTVLWVTHDEAQASRMGQHRLTMAGGRIVG